jgi:xanthine/uracil permease
VILSSGILPAAFIAIVLNLTLPNPLSEESTEDISGGLSGKS